MVFSNIQYSWEKAIIVHVQCFQFDVQLQTDRLTDRQTGRQERGSHFLYRQYQAQEQEAEH